MKAVVTKSNKRNDAKKKAEALKAAKKMNRLAKVSSASSSSVGAKKKGKSIIPQPKAKKK